MLTGAFSVLAHTVHGGWGPESEDRWFVDRDLGLLWVANGSGPTYGGYYAPFALDPGLDAFRDAFVRSRDSGPPRLLDAMAAAHATMKRLDAEYSRVLAAECARSPDGRLADLDQPRAASIASSSVNAFS